MTLRAEVAVALVHYRTPELVRPAVEALAADLERAGARARILLVDNGSDEAGRALWRGLPLERIDPGVNLGYAGGVCRGVVGERGALPGGDESRRRRAPRLPGASPRRARAGRRRPPARGSTGTRPGDCCCPRPKSARARAELAAALAPRLPGWAAIARRRWRRHARRHWLADAPLPSRALSGALLAFRRDAWSAIGPFDEAYRLYFEETDWLERLGAAGRRSVYVPAARAWHLYAQSSRDQPAASRWFAEAAARFRARRYGPGFAALLERLERRATARPPAGRSLDRAGAARPPSSRARPGWRSRRSPGVFPAAAERLAAPPLGWRLPADAERRLGPGTYHLRAVGAGGESPAWRWTRSAAP